MKPLAQRLSDRKLISHGDISSAYRARDTRLDRDVFLKILHPHFAQDVDLRTRFEREARAAAKIDHPQLVRIYEVGEDPNEGPFMLLEWVEGETLAAKIKRDIKLTPAEIRRLALSLLSGLSALHANGILHRDIKPDNILLRTDGEFKLTDFSLALLSDAPKLTHHSAVVGTPAYLAPELARGKSPSERSDLFAVGVVLYESATGHNPFYADALLESLRRVREETPDWKLLEPLSAEPDLIALIKSCLEKDAEQRPTTAAEAASLLNCHANVKTVLNNGSKRQNIFIAAATLITVIVAVVLWPNQENLQTTPATSQPVTRDSTQVVQNNPATVSIDTTRKIETLPMKAQEGKPVEIKKPDSANAFLTDKPNQQTAQQPDSFELHLDTNPWAHVTLSGADLGTTPFSSPLKLKRGPHVFMLRNPAFPPILASIDLTGNAHKEIVLAEYVQHIELTVEPWGDVYLDNEHIGTTPLNRLITVLPGSHSIRITHSTLPDVSKTWQAVAGDTIKLHANLQTSELAVRTVGDNH
ncbi:MAG: serine/threonine protein kinase [bacterium]|nr:serine/threonine protein kinase [bacterium]